MSSSHVFPSDIYNALCSKNPQEFQDAVKLLVSLSVEDRKDIEKSDPSFFETLFNDIVLISDEYQARYILEHILPSWPSWQTDIPFKRQQPLQLALQQGKLDLFDLLLAHKADRHAVSYKQGEAVNLLDASVQCMLHHKFQEVVVDIAFETCSFTQQDIHKAMLAALSYENLGGVRALFKHGARFANKEEAEEALSIAGAYDSGQERLEILKLLLQDSVAQEVIQDNTSTALFRTSWKGNLEALQLLVEHGADINSRDLNHTSQRTALMVASMQGHQKTLLWLLEQGANPLVKDNQGQNALHWLMQHVCYLSNEEDERKQMMPLALALLDKGVSLTEQNDDGQTPIDLAKEHGFVQLEAFFLSTMIKDNVKENIESKRAVGRGKGLGKLKM